MHTTGKAQIILAGIAGCISIAAALADEPIRQELAISRCITPPKIDGVLDDECWQSAALVTNFFITGSSDTIFNQHKAYVTFDTEWLYVAFDVAQPESDRNPPLYVKHDDLVQRENNVQVSFDPGTDGELYYQFLLNPANTRADFRMTRAKGRERESWNIPWRSATRQSTANWTAEVALPWCLLLTHGDLAKARFNLLITTFTPIRDRQAVQLGVERKEFSWSPLVKQFHEPERFGALRGIQQTDFSAPSLPFITTAAIGAYRLEGTQYVYDVKFCLENLSGKNGNFSIQVADQPENGAGNIFVREVLVPGNSTTNLEMAIPVKTLVKRAAMLRLVDPTSGEEWQRVLIDDTAVLDLFSCYLDRNYYTTEDNANAICKIGLPAEGLRNMRLQAQLADGAFLSKAENLQPKMKFPMPLAQVPIGTHTVAVELCQVDGNVATRQELELIKRAPKPGCEWKIDREKCIFLDNDKPFFPFGFLMNNINSSNEWAFRDIAENGFNAIIQWSRPPVGGDYIEEGRRYAELAGKYGLKVVLVPDLAYPGGGEMLTDPDGLLTTNELAKINKDITMYRSSLVSLKGMMVMPPLNRLPTDYKGRIYFSFYEKLLPHLCQFIRNAADQPNLMGYYILDEPLVMEINQDITGRHFYGQIHASDGYRPVFLLYSSEIPETPRAVNWCDALGTDPYWVPGDNRLRGTINWVTKIVANTRRRADEVHAVTFTVPMAEFWSGCRKRTILPQEQRCQTYLALIHGSRAILYFVYPIITQSVFDELKALAREMQVLGPVCLTEEIPQTTTYAPGELDPRRDKFTEIQVALRRHPDGGYVLLAANTVYAPVEAEFTLSLLKQTGTVRHLFHAKAYPVANQSFRDRFEGYGTRAYFIPPEAAQELEEAKVPVQIAVKMAPHPELAQPETPAETRKGQKNLIPNSSFEQMTVPGWPDYFRYTGAPIMPEKRTGSTAAVFGADTNQPYHGRYSLFLDGGTNITRLAYYTVRDLAYLTEQPRQFVLSAWLRANRNGVKAKMRIGGYAQKEFTLTTAWQRCALSATVPAKVDEFFLWFHNEKNQDGDRIWIDAVQFEVGDQPTEYAP